MTGMQACARWGMCLAGLLGQDWKCVWGKARNEIEAGGPLPHPVDCPQVFTVDKLAGFKQLSKKPVFEWPIPETWTGESKGVWLELPWEGKDTCCLSGGWLPQHSWKG